MELPIYQSGECYADEIEKPFYNKGLLFDRFFNGYQLQKPDIKPNEGAKIKFLGDFAGGCGDGKQLENYIARQRKLAEAVDGRYRVYQLDGHFVSGMGNSHPVENGFLWHYTLGTPYFAGSQVKGLVRSLIEQYYQGADKEKILLKWFGSDNKNKGSKKSTKTASDNQAGDLIFYDAIPFLRPYLSVDVMTPHMGNWYAEGGKIKDVKKDSDKIPADWHDPVPVPFLAVKEANFLFSIGKRPGVDIDIEQVFDLLDKALKYLGAGAKTQTGYGYMSPNENINKALAQESVDVKKQEDLERLSTNQQKVKQIYDRMEDVGSIPAHDQRFKNFYDEIIFLYQEANAWDQADIIMLKDKLNLEYIQSKLCFTNKKKSKEMHRALKEAIEK